MLHLHTSIPHVAKSVADALENNSLPADVVLPSNKSRLLETTIWSSDLFQFLNKGAHFPFFTGARLCNFYQVKMVQIVATVQAKVMVLAKC